MCVCDCVRAVLRAHHYWIGPYALFRVCARQSQFPSSVFGPPKSTPIDLVGLHVSLKDVVPAELAQKKVACKNLEAVMTVSAAAKIMRVMCMEECKSAAKHCTAAYVGVVIMQLYIVTLTCCPRFEIL